jgi:hypothetical protein
LWGYLCGEDDVGDVEFACLLVVVDLGVFGSRGDVALHRIAASETTPRHIPRDKRRERMIGVLDRLVDLRHVRRLLRGNILNQLMSLIGFKRIRTEEHTDIPLIRVFLAAALQRMHLPALLRCLPEPLSQILRLAHLCGDARNCQIWRLRFFYV